MAARKAERSLEPIIELVDDLLCVARRVNAWKYTMPGYVPLPHIEALLLRHIHRYPNASPGQLAAQLNLRPSNTSVALRGLESKDLIERHPDPDDRRCTRLTHTDRAEKAMQKVHDEWKELFEPLGISNADMETTIRVLRKLNSAVARRRMS